MKVFLIIALVLLLLPVAFFIFAIIANIFMLATGRMTKEELAAKCKARNEKKREQEKAKSAITLTIDLDGHPSLPEPVRRALNS